MNKSFLILFLLSFFISANIVQAQTTVIVPDNSPDVIVQSPVVYMPKQGFGLRAGLNAATINGRNDQVTLGPHFGAYYNIVITPHFALQPEVLYSVQGSRFSANNVTANRNLSYFNIPIMGKVYVANGLNLQFGPYVGFLMQFDTDDDADVSVKANYRGTDYGVALGAGYEFLGGFNLGARYNWGLADITQRVNTQGSTATFDTRNSNRVFQFFIGYTF